jgi:hypothetical protein
MTYLSSTMDKAKLDGANGSLGAIGNVELSENVLDVDLDCAHTDCELIGDLAIGLALRQ